MATNFPTSLDNFTNPAAGDSLTSPNHANQHADANDAIEALEAKVGVNSSAVTTSLDFRVSTVETYTSFGFVSGVYHSFPRGDQGSATTTTVSTANRGLYAPIFIGPSTTFDRIAISTASTFSGSASVRLGIYNNASGKPTSLVLDAGTVSPTASSTIYPITINQTLSAGWYWLIFVPHTLATTNTYSGTSSINNIPYTRFETGGSFSSRTFWIQTGITGALPSSATPAELSVGANMPFVALRAA